MASDQKTIDILKERASVKEYDTTHEMTKEELTELLDITTKAPSAWNLQHWHFTVFHSAESKAKLLPIAYNQKQVSQASAVIAVLGDLEANLKGEKIYSELAEQGFITEDIKETLMTQINGAYQSEQYAREAAYSNASLAAMQLMIAAKAMGYDTCAMGGFSKEAYVKEFNVSGRYEPVMLISVGKAAKEAHKSNRFDIEEVSDFL
ncbi:nitroreductase family protein [Bacillus altitudinis]|jgi:nitroreductase|uniref:Water forming NADH oxidase (Nitroreductase) n=1 Tax=Bacillus altitudinis TaxID=293387 RepID=A0A653S204_BACAB|nr:MULTISPECIES: nitroreductase family protein [Bacillus]AHL71752.1 NAD(P)H nitroreductase [Bacillus pumilus]KML10823.1 NAD(P)H nitroreductase [Bacillus stratosphericus]KQL39800.1 NAD(P)H nitroreductase [Bacillus sp. FJAT-21955]MBX7003058.1 nitroreductase family protein [Bacillus aerophilus]AKC66316.1 NAD(P)H nitroreductase [Bacillus altitudinis]